MIDENAIIARYFRPLAGEGSFDLADDAGRIRVPAGQELVVTTDVVAVGVHFLPSDPPATIAQKALRVNLSDLAAKGAEARAYMLAAVFPPDLDEGWLAEFCAGLRADQEAFGVSLIGGDTVTAPAGAPLFSVAAFGTVPAGGMVHRFNGRAGDALYVSGTIGDAAAGLAVLKERSGPWTGLGEPERNSLASRYRVPMPRSALAPVLRDHARAAMDVSDGLVGDCDKLAAASGCSARIDAGEVPVAASLTEAAQDPVVLGMLLSGGDDYEILAAVAPEREAGFRDAAAAAGVPVTRIGELTDGTGPTEVQFRGTPLALPQRSYVHGSRGEAR